MIYNQHKIFHKVSASSKTRIYQSEFTAHFYHQPSDIEKIYNSAGSMRADAYNAVNSADFFSSRNLKLFLNSYIRLIYYNIW